MIAAGLLRAGCYLPLQARWDPSKYSYLDSQTLYNWNDVAGNIDKLTPIAEAHNVQDFVINLWVGGDFDSGIFGCPKQAWLCRDENQLNGASNFQPGDGSNMPKNQDGKIKGQWVWFNYARFAPDLLNNAEQFEGGGGTVAHEVAHYLGLLHPDLGECSLPNDACTDTPPNKSPDHAFSPRQYQDLVAWCKAFRRGQQPDPKQLRGYQSCKPGDIKGKPPPGAIIPGNAGGTGSIQRPRYYDVPADSIDNVFNIMSYYHDACRMYFTENQVARMQYVMATYRDGTMNKYAV